MTRYVIKKAEVETMTGLAKTHFLNPDAQRSNRSLGDVTGLTGLGFHIVEVAPGKASTEYHVHHYEDECVYILAGRAEVDIGGECTTVEPGDFIGYRAGGAAHTMRNTGSEVLRCIVVGMRLAHDVSDYPRLGKRLYRNAGQAWDLVDLQAISHIDVGRKV